MRSKPGLRICAVSSIRRRARTSSRSRDAPPGNDARRAVRTFAPRQPEALKAEQSLERIRQQKLGKKAG
jgi:hypothetical protein